MLAPNLWFSQENLGYCCGVDEVGGFTLNPEDWAKPWKDQTTHFDGTGMFVSTFIDDEACKIAYECLCSKHKLLFQSEPMVNTNSGRRLFLCVFLHE